MMTFLQAATAIESAGSMLILSKGEDPHIVFRNLAQVVHPDHVTNPKLTKRAQDAFAKLSALHDDWENLSTKGAPLVTLGSWTVDTPYCKGDVADLYLVHNTSKGVLKIASDEDDNDLMEAEYQNLAKLYACPEALRNFWKYLPTPLDTFEASNRKANVFVPAEGFMPLSDIVKMFPSGLGFRHVVWMMNRLLSTIGFIQRNGIVHGGILPCHLMYEPAARGLVLVGWCSSVEMGKDKYIPILAKDWATFYPPEVSKKHFAHPTTDIYMAAKCMIHAADKVPVRFQPLLDWCLASSPSARPVDAWELMDRWTELAKAEYGKPSYQALTFPKN